MRPPVKRPPFRAWLVVFAALVSVTPARGSEPPVAVGEIHGATSAGEFSAPLRSALVEGVQVASLGRARERFVLSATLVRLDAERVGQGARATAAVSLVLRRAREQSLHAVLNGHATAEETNATLSETREDALRAAVRSALRGLPEAVR